MDRSPSPRGHPHKNLSPRYRMRMDGFQNTRIPFGGAGEGKSSSIERREDYAFCWPMDAGRTEGVHSGNVLPPYMLDRDRHNPQFDGDDEEERVAQRKCKYAEHLDYHDASKSNRLKQVYGYDHHGGPSRLSKDWDYSGKRIVDIKRHGIIGQKSVHPEDGITRVPYQMPLHMVPTSTSGETGRHLPSLSRDVYIDQFERAKLPYPEPLPSERISLTDYFKQCEGKMLHSKDISYNKVPAFLSKTSEGPPWFRDVADTSSGALEFEFSNPHRKGLPLCTSNDERPRSSAKFMEPVHSNAYYERSIVDVRDLEAGKRIVSDYPQGPSSPKMVKHEDYLYPTLHRIVNDGNLHPSGDLFRTMPPHSRLDFEHSLVDYEHRELSRPMYPLLDEADHAKNSYENISVEYGHPNMQNLADTKDSDTSGILCTSKHFREYLGSGYTQVEFERIESQDNETSLSGFTQDHQPSHLRSNYGFGREASPEFQKEKFWDPMSTYNLEILRQRMIDKSVSYEPSDKVLKRKYIMEEDIINHDPRTTMSRTWNLPEQLEDMYDSSEEWIDEDTSFFHASRTKMFDHSACRKAWRTNNGHEQLGDPASENWLSSHESLARAQRHSLIHYKPTVKYIKGHPKPRFSSLYKSHQTDRRIGIHRRQRIGKRNHEHNEDEHENDDNPSEDWVNTVESEPTEDSEEFQKLVDKAFLEYSKRLNLNSSVRRRYKEQGKVGSLFCIVCGKSLSKEFMDTQRLVTHAFMSHKVGLRAQHLGLHKAICILMGWKSSVPCGNVTWVPEVLPKIEALVQKENLILWPPVVVIHNISLSNNNPEQQKVIPIEGVQAFLRGKGFVGGKMKVCLGKPADQSVILVKFLGTFTGLGNAERLHKYFADNKCGREDFELKTGNKGKSSIGWVAGLERDNLEEHLLYGYMGIAEDLDSLDFNTKKWILIKNKVEIRDLTNAPVKTEARQEFSNTNLILMLPIESSCGMVCLVFLRFCLEEHCNCPTLIVKYLYNPFLRCEDLEESSKSLTVPT